MTEMETKMCWELDARFAWISKQLGLKYPIGDRYGQNCFAVDSEDVEAITLHKAVIEGRSHALFLEYAFTGDGFFSEDGDWFPIEEYQDREKMLREIIREIEE